MNSFSSSGREDHRISKFVFCPPLLFSASSSSQPIPLDGTLVRGWSTAYLGLLLPTSSYSFHILLHLDSCKEWEWMCRNGGGIWLLFVQKLGNRRCLWKQDCQAIPQNELVKLWGLSGSFSLTCDREKLQFCKEEDLKESLRTLSFGSKSLYLDSRWSHFSRIDCILQVESTTDWEIVCSLLQSLLSSWL